MGGITSISGDGTPAGIVKYFANSTAPNGYLKANGAAVSRATYAALFIAIGTLYGAGDGSTTFNVPDLRGEFPRGFDDGRGVDTGRGIGTNQLDAMQGHRHTTAAGPTVGGNGVAVSYTGSGAYDASGDGTPKSDGTNGTPRTAAETRSRNVALLACIKY